MVRWHYCIKHIVPHKGICMQKHRRNFFCLDWSLPCVIICCANKCPTSDNDGIIKEGSIIHSVVHRTFLSNQPHYDCQAPLPLVYITIYMYKLNIAVFSDCIIVHVNTKFTLGNKNVLLMRSYLLPYKGLKVP